MEGCLEVAAPKQIVAQGAGGIPPVGPMDNAKGTHPTDLLAERRLPFRLSPFGNGPHDPPGVVIVPQGANSRRGSFSPRWGGPSTRHEASGGLPFIRL